MQVTQSGPGPEVGVLRPCSARDTTGVAAYDALTAIRSHARFCYRIFVIGGC
jgi:hypothetical protein